MRVSLKFDILLLCIYTVNGYIDCSLIQEEKLSS